MPKYKGLREILARHFQKNNRAFFSKEFERAVPKGFSSKSLNWVLKQMLVEGEVVRSQRCFYTGKPKGFGFLYAKSVELVNQRIKELEERLREKPFHKPFAKSKLWQL